MIVDETVKNLPSWYRGKGMPRELIFPMQSILSLKLQRRDRSGHVGPILGVSKSSL